MHGAGLLRLDCVVCSLSLHLISLLLPEQFLVQVLAAPELFPLAPHGREDAVRIFVVFLDHVAHVVLLLLLVLHLLVHEQVRVAVLLDQEEFVGVVLFSVGAVAVGVARAVLSIL